MPELYDDCGQVLNEPSKPGQPRERRSAQPALSMPFNATAADVRAEILVVLGSWSGMVVEQRGVTAPRRTVNTLARFLGIHVDWIAAHPAAGDATSEVARLVRSARRVAYPGAVRRVTIGACVNEECPGELIAVLRVGEKLPLTEITCSADPNHSWPAHQWVQLSRRLKTAAASPAPGARWLSAADISRLWGLPTGSVYRLASERRWRRQSQAGRTCYSAADVEDTFGQREPGTGPR